MLRPLFPTLLLGLSTALAAQPGVDLLTRMRRAYQDQSAVYLKRNTTVRIERRGTGTVAYREVEEQRLMLKDMSGSAQQEEVHYSGLIPLQRLEAYTMVPQGRGFKRIPVSAIDHRDERDDHIFHDDSRVATFVLPALNSGAIAHIAYHLSYPDARMAGGHFFAGAYPVEESVFTVISDPGIEVDIRTFNVPDSQVVRTSTVEKGRNVQRLTMRRVSAMRFEQNAPAGRYHAPHALLVVRTPEGGPELSDIERLYRWYYDHVRATFGEVPAELKALSDSLTAGAGTDRDKAARIHRWVQDNVRYVAFEDGMNGLIPAPATEVCRTRYGDCKGMSNLLTTLLRSAGLDAHLAWVGTRSLPYTLEDLPTIANHDHMIVALDLEGTTLFLDPTAATNAFGIPSGFTQGKQAFIAIDSLRHRVETIPVMPARSNQVMDSVYVRIRGNDLEGHGTAEFTGYDRYRLAQRLRGVPTHRLAEALRSVLMKGSNKFLLDSLRVIGMDDRDAPLVLHYQFRIPDHVRQGGERIYLPITLSDPWKDYRFREDRKLPVEFPYEQMRRHIVTLELPATDRVLGVPSLDAMEFGSFGYGIDIAAGEGLITSSATYHVNELMIDSELGDWQRMNQALMKEIGRTIVIELSAP